MNVSWCSICIVFLLCKSSNFENLVVSDGGGPNVWSLKLNQIGSKKWPHKFEVLSPNWRSHCHFFLLVVSVTCVTQSSELDSSWKVLHQWWQSNTYVNHLSRCCNYPPQIYVVTSNCHYYWLPLVGRPASATNRWTSTTTSTVTLAVAAPAAAAATAAAAVLGEDTY